MTSWLAFAGAAVLEIAGCFAFWAWLRLGQSVLWLLPGMAALAGFAALLTIAESPLAGRAYAAYGGIYITAALLWGWLVEGHRPDGWDVTGAVICLIGMAVILFAPRAMPAQRADVAPRMSPHLSGSRHAHVPAKPIGCSRARHIFAVNRIPNTPTENAEDHMGTLISFKRPDGQEAKGYLAKAAQADAPGVVVIQEWWGLQDQIKGMCDRFALAGFNALAPDLYKGTVVPYHDTDAAGREMNSLDFMDATTQTVRGAAQYLARNGAKVGLTGFCLGGAVTIIGATRIDELTAGVVFYGIPPEQAAKPADVKIPLQAHFANKDDWCTPALVDGFEAAMKAAGKSLELYRYDAEHAFVNEQRMTVHDRAAAELAWGRATAFFHKHLG